MNTATSEVETTNPLVAPVATIQEQRMSEQEKELFELRDKVRDLQQQLDRATSNSHKLCEVNQTLRRSIDQQAKMIWELTEAKPYHELRHAGMHGYRAEYQPHSTRDTWINAEAVFRDHWRKENDRQPGLNSGFGTLELLLNPEINEGFGSGRVSPITQRDCTVAATLVQWLGTNCGQAFICEVETEIKRRREKAGKEFAGARVVAT